MNDDLDKRIARLEAHAHIQAADISALLVLFREVAAAVRPMAPSIPDVDSRFLSLRKESLHTILELLEKHDPAKAARLQQMIDDSAKFFPYDYDSH